MRWVDPSGLDAINTGHRAIVVKPEHAPPRRLRPGGRYYGNIDGVRVKRCGKWYWYKVKGNDYLRPPHVYVRDDGEVYRDGGSWFFRNLPEGPDIPPYLIFDQLPGYKDANDFVSRHEDWKK